MKCPKCGAPLRVTHSYAVPEGQTQRMVCDACKTICTTQKMIVAVDPRYGQGAASLAERLRRKNRRP